MWRVFKTVCFIVCPLLAVAYAMELSELLAQWPENPRLQVLGVGFVAGVLAWWALSDELALWAVVEHELTHVLAALLSFQRVRGIAASDTSGVTALEEGTDNFVITLAPYFLPTLALLWLPALVLFRDGFQVMAVFVLGLLLGYHALSNIQEFHLGQPDIHRSGTVFSLLFCITLSLIFFGFVVAVAACGSLAAGVGFWVDGFRGSVAMPFRLASATAGCLELMD